MPYKPPLPDLHPNIQKVHAVVTTRWNGKGYRPLSITSLEDYFIDTALDNDADSWQIDIGDPDGDYLAFLKRDNEIRVQLYGVGREGLSYMLTGIADTAEYSEQGIWNLVGRDLSSLATDSTVLPHRWAKSRAWSIVRKQAHDIGFHKTQLSRTGIVKKMQYTDGSESYWDFWYRLYRQEKMWLWTLPDGTLIGNKLNYSADPLYYLGDRKAGDGAHVQNMIIPVISVVATKSTQGRIEEVVVYGSRGNTGFNVTANDPTMKKWKKRPRKVMLDTTSRTPNAAKRAAWEEIFEGKIGSVELRVTVPDPGFVIRQNEIARLYIKDIDLLDQYFVVGSRIQGGPDGFVQEVRLREKQMAVSARVPTAPKLNTGGGGAGSTAGAGSLEIDGMPKGWGDFFVKAAKKYHGNMSYALFLACLMGIGHVETGFQNERENGGPGPDGVIWHPFVPPTNLPNPGIPPGTPGVLSRQEWEQMFANEPGVYGISRQFGVGPMQLTSIGIKHEADDLMGAGKRNQYSGGRWHPEFNIMIAAKSLHTCVQGTHAARDIDIWIAVDAYNRGVQGALSYYAAHKHVSSYAEAVRKAVTKDPGYLAQVTAALQAGSQASKEGWTSPALNDNGSPAGLPTAGQIHTFFNNFNTKGTTGRRKAIQYAAYWGWYNRSAIHYRQTRPMKDMNPPPNFPGEADCSQFATWCYKAAGAPDPNGESYNGSGNTSTMLAHGKRITAAQLQPGDLVFYTSPAHVAVYVGGGLVCELGSDPGPLFQPVKYRSDILGYRSYF
jgi:cell wall-associated NlpC family hydrolase/prophage tail gpP-like protein